MPFSDLDRWADSHPGRRPLALALLFAGAMLVLGLGIWEPTGVTGKDEYYLSLRTPMCMVEQEAWLVPCLDGEPRLKKPPMLYWLGRASFELFGVSLTSARLVAVTLGAALVLGIALIGLELSASLAYGLLAGVGALSFVGLAIGARMLELDVPVAAFSTLAFYALLRWYRRDGGPLPALAAAALLATGFLTKGPVVLVVCGAGGLALLVTDRRARTFLLHRWGTALSAALLALALALPWFLYVHHLYPGLSTRELTTELAARDFLQLSPVPLYGILLLALPWSFLPLALLAGWRRLPGAERNRTALLLLWLALTLLPFFFIKSFERYLYGSMVPLALLAAQLIRIPMDGLLRWSARLGLLVAAPLVLLLLAVVTWLHGPGLAVVTAAAVLAGFAWYWARARRPLPMSLSAVLLWSATLGLLYPQLGINRIPPHILQQARQQPVAFYNGPQPALLPILLGRSLVKLDQRWRLPAALQRPCARFLLFAAEAEAGAVRAGLERLGYRVRERERFGVLSSRVSWYHMARPGLSREQVWQELKQGELAAIEPQVVMYQVEKAGCPVD